MGTFVQKFEIEGVVSSLLPHGIEAIPAEECNAGKECDSTQGCGGGCGSCGGKKRIRKFSIPLRSSHSYRTGQHITFRYYAYHETIGALIVFGLPLICAAVALFAWYLLRPDMVESGWALLSSGIGLLLGFAVVRIIDRIFSRAYPPVLLTTHETAALSTPASEPSHDG